jgi:hypothetical protein
MTRTCKIHTLRVIARLVGVLTVPITAALLAQTIAGRPRFDKPNAVTLQSASTPIKTHIAPAFGQALGTSVESAGPGDVVRVSTIGAKVVGAHPTDSQSRFLTAVSYLTGGASSSFFCSCRF